MRWQTTTGIVAAAVVGTIAVGSGLAAWADWSVGAAPAQVAATGDILPAVKKPEAALAGGVPKVDWAAVQYASGQAVGGYLVFRNDAGDQREVCRVPATTLTCTDGAAEKGRAVTYTVHAIAGDRWAGPSSPISDLVIRPRDPGAASLAAGRPSPSARSGSANDDITPGEKETISTPTPAASPSASTEAAPAQSSPSPSAIGTTGPGGGQPEEPGK